MPTPKISVSFPVEQQDTERGFDDSFKFINGFVASPTELGANQNNYDPGPYNVLRLSSDDSRNITGFGDGDNGRFLHLINVGANDIVIQNQNVGSDAANRVITGLGGDMTLVSDEWTTLWYDIITARWRVVAKAH